MAKPLDVLLREAIVPAGLTLDKKTNPPRILPSSLLSQIRNEGKKSIAATMSEGEIKCTVRLYSDPLQAPRMNPPDNAQYILDFKGEWYFYDQSGKIIAEFF